MIFSPSLAADSRHGSCALLAAHAASSPASKLHADRWVIRGVGQRSGCGTDRSVMGKGTEGIRTAVRAQLLQRRATAADRIQIHRKRDFISSAAHRAICFPCVLQIRILIFLLTVALIAVLSVILLNQRISLSRLAML